MAPTPPSAQLFTSKSPWRQPSWVQLCVVLLLCAALRPVSGSQFSHSDGQGESLPDGYTVPPHLLKPAEARNRSYIDEVLKLTSEPNKKVNKATLKRTLYQLKDIYHKNIQPLEEEYKFSSLGHPVITDGEIMAKPMVLLLGPWSTGKSTMINYLVGASESTKQLHTGAEPTTSDFTVVMEGDSVRSIEGIVLAADTSRPFAALEKFGQNFLEKFTGLELPLRLLEKVTLVDTPGIIENRKQQERGYPFNDVIQWFMDRSDLILCVFDPTKLDVGAELETLFHKMKGREHLIRLVLNKSDSIAMQELMRVYGALFWNLAPLINVTEPPRVYTGSFWSRPYKEDASVKLFMQEEISLLQDINDIIENRLHNKVANIRQHAIKVRIHTLIVDKYIEVFNIHKPSSYFKKQKDIMSDIIDNPDKYNIFRDILQEKNVSKYDLPDLSSYKEFFRLHPIEGFSPMSTLCSVFTGCPIEKLDHAISNDLPNLLTGIKYERKVVVSDPVEEVSRGGGSVKHAPLTLTCPSGTVATDGKTCEPEKVNKYRKSYQAKVLAENSAAEKAKNN